MRAMTPFRRSLLYGALAGMLAIGLAGCGGKSGSSTGPSTSSNTLKKLNVKVVRSAAEAPASSMIARLGEMLGWPQIAEAATCTVTAGVTPNIQTATTTDTGGEVTLTNVGVDAAGNVPVTIDCGVGAVSNVTLTGLAANMTVTVTVEVKPGKVEVKAQDTQVSDVSVSEPSEVSEPSVSSTTTGTTTTSRRLVRRR